MRDVRDVLTPGHAASTRLVRVTRHFVASVPYAKHTKGRVVIAPKWHQCSASRTRSDEELADLGALLQLVMAAVCVRGNERVDVALKPSTSRL